MAVVGETDILKAHTEDNFRVINEMKIIRWIWQCECWLVGTERSGRTFLIRWYLDRILNDKQSVTWKSEISEHWWISAFGTPFYGGKCSVILDISSQKEVHKNLLLNIFLPLIFDVYRVIDILICSDKVSHTNPFSFWIFYQVPCTGILKCHVD